MPRSVTKCVKKPKDLDFAPETCHHELMKDKTAVTLYTNEILQTLTARELNLIADLEAELGEKLTEAEIIEGIFINGRSQLAA